MSDEQNVQIHNPGGSEGREFKSPHGQLLKCTVQFVYSSSSLLGNYGIRQPVIYLPASSGRRRKRETKVRRGIVALIDKY